MSGARYERVAGQDDDTPSATPNSPPPSFRSRASSPSRAQVDQTLADTFDSDSDNEDQNGDDDRQRLMRTDGVTTMPPATRRPLQSERRPTVIPQFVAPTPGGRTYGGGSQSDGVFANLSAKPETGEKVEEHPPTYEQAAADAAPPYWETTILAPGLGGPDDVYIDGLPVGSVFSFIWNAMISMSFQLVGFVLTYLLHTTHAAKNGSRAGLGITLVQYGFYMKGAASKPSPDNSGAPPPDPDAHDFDPTHIAAGDTGTPDGITTITTSEYFAYVLMIVGWFILIRSISDYLRARRHEMLVLQSPERGLNVPVIAEGEQAETVV